MGKSAKFFVIRMLRAIGLSIYAREAYNWCKYLLNTSERAANKRLISQGAPDGLPLPPVKLVYLVSGRFDIVAYYKGGAGGAAGIKGLLQKNGVDMNTLGSILDFGCGCGRTIRHWKSLTGPKIYGCDYNPRLVEWCKNNIGFAEFSTNGLNAKLGYEDGMFGFIYVISVFTHFDKDRQVAWINELRRVIKNGGYLLITVHGRNRLSHLTEDERKQFESGSLVVVSGEEAGSNECAAYHPERYVRDVLAQGFTVVDFVPGDIKGTSQDSYLLRKDG